MTDTDRLRELGFVRLMAPASEENLVFGTFHAGHYPIQWRRRANSAVQMWSLFGVRCDPLLPEDVERIVAHLGSRVSDRHGAT